MRLSTFLLSRVNGTISGQWGGPNSKGPRISVSNLTIPPWDFIYSTDSFSTVSGSSAGTVSMPLVYSNPRSHNAVPAVAEAFTVIMPDPLVVLNSVIWESNVRPAQSEGLMVTRLSNSALSVPSPVLVALVEAVQRP